MPGSEAVLLQLKEGGLIIGWDTDGLGAESFPCMEVSEQVTNCQRCHGRDVVLGGTLALTDGERAEIYKDVMFLKVKKDNRLSHFGRWGK